MYKIHSVSVLNVKAGGSNGYALTLSHSLGGRLLEVVSAAMCQ
jgi:hypothetical protein